MGIDNQESLKRSVKYGLLISHFAKSKKTVVLNEGLPELTNHRSVLYKWQILLGAASPVMH